MARYLASVALLPGGWAENVVLEVDPAGHLSAVESGLSDPGGEVDARLPGAVIPGVVDAHSHAFQRALAGGAELRTRSGDSFWSWRDQMYRFLAVLEPEDVEAVAARLYLELLRHGYTRVVEFHYLHNAPDGSPYDDPSELSRRLVAAAASVGMGLTLLPVLYRASGFGGAPPGEGQRRFTLDVEAFLSLVERIDGWAPSDCTPGFAFHSLRAVTPDDMAEVLDALGRTLMPRHIHVAEQPREVEASVAWSGRRPVEWLLEHVPLDARWGLVHCTHMTADEIRQLAATEACAVVCPTTEGNLGDGIFPLRPWLHADGALAVGSDSQVSVSPVEELRWLEYGQRLVTGERAVAASTEHPSTARSLLEAVWEGGARAGGLPPAALRPGSRADLLILDLDHPALVGRTGDALLDGWVFSGNDNPVREVWVGGKRVVYDGRHPEEDRITASFQQTMRALLQRR